MGKIRVDFPTIQRKVPDFQAFQVNKRNFSAYFRYLLVYLLINRNFSVYLSDWVLNLVPQPIGADPFDARCGN